MPILLDELRTWNETRNGSDFLTLPGEYTTTVKANVGELVKIRTKFRYFWEVRGVPANADSLIVALIAGATHSLTTTYGQDFEAAGFRKGDTFDFVDIGGAVTYPGQIVTFVSGSYMEFTLAAALPPGTYANAEAKGTTHLDTLNFDFNFTDANDSSNLVSNVFGLIQNYEFSGLVKAGGDVNGVPKSPIYWQSGSAAARQLADFDAYTQQYEIDIITKIPYFQEGQFINLETEDAPDLFKVGTLFYSQLIRLQSGANLNTRREEEINRTVNDSIGWFQENFDGGARQYSAITLAYNEVVSGGSRDVPDVTEQTMVTLTVAANGATFLANDPYVVKVSYLPTESAYKSGIDNFNDTWINEHLRSLLDTGLVSGSIITDLSASVDDPNNITVTFKIGFSAAQLAKMFNQGEFLLSIDLENSAAAVESSNRVNLIIDAVNIDKNSDIAGLFQITKDEVYYFDEEFEDGVTAGQTNLDGWNEENFMRDIEFSITTDADLVELTSLEALVIAYNTVNQNYFIIQSVQVPTVTQSITVDSGKQIQQLSTDTTRGLLAKDETPYNFLKVSTGTFSDPTQEYSLQIGQMVNWQDWQELLTADTVFYNVNEPNNGLNRKTSNYSEVSNYEIRLATLAKVKKNNVITEYLTIGPTSRIFDYDKDRNLSPLYSTQVTYKDTLGNAITKRALVNEDTTVLAIFDDGNSKSNPDKFQAIFRLEPKQQGTEKNIALIDSANEPLEDQALKPLVLSTKVKKSIILNKFAAECLIDGTKLIQGAEYSLTAAMREVAALDQICFLVIGSPSFDPIVTVSLPVDVTWNFGDGSPEVISLSPVHVYGDTNDYTVCMKMEDFSLMTSINMATDGVKGALDLSKLVNSTSFGLTNNGALTSITNPTTATIITSYFIDSCDITGNLDLSGMTGLSGLIRFNNNSNLTSVTNPSSSQNITQYWANSCNITGTIDLSGLTGLGGDIRLQSNANLTAVTFPSSSQATSLIYVNNCNLSTLDLSSMTGMAGQFRAQQNSNLTSITLPASSGVQTTFWAYSCNLGYVDFTVLTGANNGYVIRLENNSMTAAEVNHILVDLDGKGWINGNINIAGTNAAPDGTSGGYDGLTAKTNLIGKGWTVTTN